MSQILKCHTPSLSNKYDIEIHSQLLDDHALLFSRLKGLGSRFVIITHPNIATLYAGNILAALNANSIEAHLFTFPSGEQHKNRENKQILEDQMLAKELGKETCIIALGGGVVSDIAGYLAATYCRGIPFVTIPTSLLGMVDASIGGKTGVNVPQGKNLIGCIYQPKKVLIDVSLLRSLPMREFRNGMVEMIKHGLILDAAYFDHLEAHAPQLLLKQSDILEKAIYDSCRLKKDTVEKDERDNSIRNLLNFGHTIGHALEKLTDYVIPHGEAVAIGILVESYLSVQLGFLKESELQRIQNLFTAYSLPLKLPARFSEQLVRNAMKSDKKSQNSKPRFVILESIGTAHTCDMQYCRTVDDRLIAGAVDWMNAHYC